MANRRKGTQHSLAVKTAELAFAVPQVVAHRVARMALAGTEPSARDRREFSRMIAEKNAAFAESWIAMSTQAVLANQGLATSFFRSFFAAASGKQPSAVATATQVQRATLAVLGKGLAPVYRKATANAKRLARTKLR